MGKRVVVTLRCHCRPVLLDRVIRYYSDLNSSRLPVEISLMVDRPTKEVQNVIRLHESSLAQVFDAPFPIVSFEGGNRFPEAAQIHYQRIGGLRPSHVIFADDDRWFEEGFREELLEAVTDDGADLFYADSLFFWTPTHYRTDFYRHRSVALYRYDPADYFDANRHLQAPINLLTSAERCGRVRQLKSRLLDFGYCGREERIRLFRVFKEVGRLDKVIMHLLDENPVLEEYNGKT